jgi:hypothetical protein
MFPDDASPWRRGHPREIRMPGFGKSGIRALQQHAMLDGAPNYSTEVLTQHVRGLWRNVGLLEQQAGVAGFPENEIILQVGSASITLKKDGTIIIKGKDITIEGSGKINIKASGDLVMKGSKISQN